MSEPSDILFISDLHLDRNKPDITQNLLHFLETRAIQARVLYILGDLFEVWLGDDDTSAHLEPVIDRLKMLSTSVNIHFIHGNRDFLIGQQLAERCGMTIIHEPVVIQLDSMRVGLMHGDLLCTDDVDYQNFRKLVRNPDWQQEFLSKPLSERQQIAAALRDQSAEAMAQKDYEIMDVNQRTVDEQFQALNIDVLIHGHTHRPAIHQMPQHRQRIVLGDWHPSASYLSWSNGHFQLEDNRL